MDLKDEHNRFCNAKSLEYLIEDVQYDTLINVSDKTPVNLNQFYGPIKELIIVSVKKGCP